MGECTKVTNKITFINIFLLNGPGWEASFVPEQSGYLCHRRKPAQVDSSLLFDFYRSGKILFLFWFDSDVVIDVLRLVTTQNGLGEFLFFILIGFFHPFINILEGNGKEGEKRSKSAKQIVVRAMLWPPFATDS